MSNTRNMRETTVIIVGAGPAGLAASACLNRLHIPNLVLEKEDCYASLWKKRSYDRLKLHLAKEFCNLPYKPFPPNAPRFVPKSGFISYLDNYVSNFGIEPLLNRCVVSGCHDKESQGWCIVAKNTCLDKEEVYFGQFLVVATGENSEGFIPKIPGLDSFGGEYIHSSKYVNGNDYKGKDVLVVGCGNSGMEIAYDLSNYGAKTSIVVRGPVHILSKKIVWLSMTLLKFLPVNLVDIIAVLLGKLVYGDLSKYGLPRPKEGPFYLKGKTGRSATIDVGCVKMIKKNMIKIFPPIKSVDELKCVKFANGDMHKFDCIIFATGYKSTVRNWFKDDGNLFDETGMPQKNISHHWKGENGLYCTGFARQGLFGISNDAKSIAEDISFTLTQKKKSN